MFDFFIIVYWSTGALALIFSLAIHFAEVVPVLRGHGGNILTGWINIYHLAELWKYKEICIAENRPLKWYNLIKRLWIFLGFWVLGWVLLFLGSFIFEQL